MVRPQGIAAGTDRLIGRQPPAPFGVGKGVADQNIVQIDLYPGVRRRMSADIDLPIGTVIDDIDRHAARGSGPRPWLEPHCRRRPRACPRMRAAPGAAPRAGPIPGNGKRQRAGAFGSRLSGDILRRFRDHQHDDVAGLEGFGRVRQLCRQAELPAAGFERISGSRTHSPRWSAVVCPIGRPPSRTVTDGMGFRPAGDHGVALRIDADDIESGCGTGGKPGAAGVCGAASDACGAGRAAMLGRLLPGLRA